VKKPKHIAQIHKERSLQNAQNKGLKKDIIDIQEKAITNHTKTSLYTYVLKDIQKNIYKIGKTMTLMPGLRACVLGASTSSLSQQRR
jgi:hypothetical protein